MKFYWNLLKVSLGKDENFTGIFLKSKGVRIFGEHHMKLVLITLTLGPPDESRVSLPCFTGFLKHAVTSVGSLKVSTIPQKMLTRIQVKIMQILEVDKHT